MTNYDVLSLGELKGMIAPLLRRYGLRGASLFGSYARGQAKATSDIDVLVDGGSSFRALDVYAFGEDLREASGKDVDVFELSELSDGPFRATVLREAVAI